MNKSQKKTYTKPILTSEAFVPNEYVAACETHKEYGLKCDTTRANALETGNPPGGHRSTEGYCGHISSQKILTNSEGIIKEIYEMVAEIVEQLEKDEEKLKYITYEEFNKLISVVDNNLYYVLFHFLYYTGCRIGEVLALNWEDINFDTREIKINKTLSEKVYDGGYKITSTKNNLNRTIKLSQTLYDVMVKFLEERKQYTDYDPNWFVFGDYRPLPQTTIRRYKKKYFELAELKEITLHEFRHSHVSLLINEYIKTSKEKNMKVDTAKFFLMMSNRMGHTIEVMQKTYMHLFPSIQDEIVDLLDNM